MSIRPDNGARSSRRCYDHLGRTAELLAAADDLDAEELTRRTEMRERITKLDIEIDAYRTILREQPDTASEVAKWMAQPSKTTPTREPARRPTHHQAHR